VGNFIERSGELIPRDFGRRGRNGWYKDNSFSGSDSRSKYKVVNEAGRKLVSFCKTLKFGNGE
jgi:hypothetical protein